MTEFIINEYISVKLEDNKTNIYIDNKLFKQCKFLLFTIPIHDIEKVSQNTSVDELEESLDRSMEMSRHYGRIPPETEFWAHCSNLQVWFENNYDTRYLHRNMAFPLLKRLTEEGDSLAKRVFKEEIAKRIQSGYPNVIKYLLLEGYIEYLNKEEWEVLVEENNCSLLKNMSYYFLHRDINYPHEYLAYNLFEKIRKIIPEKFIESVINFLMNAIEDAFSNFLKSGSFLLLTQKEFGYLIESPKINIIKKLIKMGDFFTEDFKAEIYEIFENISNHQTLYLGKKIIEALKDCTPLEFLISVDLKLLDFVSARSLTEMLLKPNSHLLNLIIDLKDDPSIYPKVCRNILANINSSKDKETICEILKK